MTLAVSIGVVMSCWPGGRSSDEPTPPPVVGDHGAADDETASPAEQPAAGALQATPGMWRDLHVPFGESGDLWWSVADWQDLQIDNAAVAAVLDLDGDGLRDVIVSSYPQVPPHALCQRRDDFVPCPMPLPQDVATWRDVYAYDRDGGSRVIALAAKAPPGDLSFVEALLEWASDPHGPQPQQENVLLEYQVRAGAWTLLRRTALQTDGCDAYQIAHVSDLDGDGWNDVMIGTAPACQALAFRGGPDGLALAEPGFAPPGNAKASVILGNWDAEGRREAFALSYSTIGQPGEGTTCSLGRSGAWTGVPCGDSLGRAAAMGGDMIDTHGAGLSLLSSDVGGEMLHVVGAGGTILGSDGLVGFDASLASGIVRDVVGDDGSTPYRTTWTVVCGSFEGILAQQCFVANSYDGYPYETWDHPLLLYRVDGDGLLTRDANETICANFNVRSLLGPVDLNEDGCPDVIALPVFREGVHATTGVHVLLNGTCGAPAVKVQLRTPNDEPAFGAIVTVLYGEERERVALASSGGAASHRDEAALWVPQGASVEIRWANGQVQAIAAPLGAVIVAPGAATAL